MNDPVDEAKGELGEALRARRSEPSKDAEEAAAQIGDLRSALTRDIDVLRGRLPEPTEVTGQIRTVGGVVGGGLAVVGGALLLLRKRSAHLAAERRVREQAVALARELSRLDLEPEEVVRQGGRGGRMVLRLGVVVAALGGLAAAVLAIRQRLQGDDEVWEP